MAKIKPTKAQSKVIDFAQNSDLLVSASAGTGKTTVMINRIASLIATKKVKPERVLALTFTNAAAAEMKQKLFACLREAGAGNQILLDAIFALPSCDICTIDSFCQKVVKSLFYFIGAEPVFYVLQPASSDLLKEQALDIVLQRAYAAGSERFLNLTECFFEKRNLNSLKEVILSIFRHLEVQSDKEGFLQNFALNGYTEKLDQNKSAQIVNDHVVAEIAVMAQALQNFITPLKALGYKTIVSFAQRELCKLFSIKPDAGFAENFTALQNLHIAMGADIKGIDAKSTENEHKKELTQILKNMRDRIATLRNLYGGESLEAVLTLLRQSRENVTYLIEIARDFSTVYKKLKTEKNFYDFADLEEKTYEILCLPEARKIIQDAYDYVFVDEYQDINSLQESILRFVAKAGNSFAVGDAKQSIYRFRLTNPKIFIDKFNTFMQEETQVGAALTLNDNFRSFQSILQFVNKIFSRLMTQQTAGVDYAVGRFTEVEQLSEKPGVELYIINQQKEKDELKTPQGIYSVVKHKNLRDEEDSKARLEGILAVNAITALRQKGEGGRIAVLARSKGSYTKEVLRTIKSFGIPVVSTFENKVFEVYENSLLSAILCLVSNPCSDQYLAEVLLSPVVSFSADELSVFTQARQKKDKFFYEAFYRSQEAAVQVFTEKLNRLHMLSQNLPVDAIARHAIAQFNLIECLEPYYENAEANFADFINLIKQSGVANLTEFAALFSTGEVAALQTQNVPENAVVAATIHASKGLEYDHVLLVGLGKEFNEQDFKKKFIIDQETGIGLEGFDLEKRERYETLAKSGTTLIARKHMAMEEIRLLYVAMTRAKKSLHLIGHTNLQKADCLKTDRDIFEARSFMSLLLGALLPNELEEIKKNKDFVLKNNKHEAIATVATFKPEELLAQVKTKTVLQKEQGYQKIKLGKLINYAHLQAAETPAKTNVTELSKQKNADTDYAAVLLTPEAGESILRGNAYHKFFALFSFDAKDLNAETARVRGVLTPEENSFVEDKIINKFFKTEVFAIAQNSQVLKEQRFVVQESAQSLNIKNVDEKVLVQGAIDLLLIQEDGFIVVDYKASGIKNIAENDVYIKQIKLYAQISAKILGKKCKNMFIYSIFDGKIQSIY